MVFLLSFVIFFLLVFILIWQLSNLVSLFFGVPFDKTPREQIKKAFKMVDLKPDEMVYDLGSGDGSALVTAAKDFKARALGFEISPWFYLISNWNLKRSGINPKAKVVFKDFRKADLKKADVIYLYLMPKVIEGLKEKFSNLKPNTRLISFKFPIEGLKLYRKEEKIYVYKI